MKDLVEFASSREPTAEQISRARDDAKWAPGCMQEGRRASLFSAESKKPNPCVQQTLCMVLPRAALAPSAQFLCDLKAEKPVSRGEYAAVAFSRLAATSLRALGIMSDGEAAARRSRARARDAERRQAVAEAAKGSHERSGVEAVMAVAPTDDGADDVAAEPKVYIEVVYGAPDHATITDYTEDPLGFVVEYRIWIHANAPEKYFDLNAAVNSIPADKDKSGTFVITSRPMWRYWVSRYLCDQKTYDLSQDPHLVPSWSTEDPAHTTAVFGVNGRQRASAFFQHEYGYSVCDGQDLANSAYVLGSFPEGRVFPVPLKRTGRILSTVLPDRAEFLVLETADMLLPRGEIVDPDERISASGAGEDWVPLSTLAQPPVSAIQEEGRRKATDFMRTQALRFALGEQVPDTYEKYTEYQERIAREFDCVFTESTPFWWSPEEKEYIKAWRTGKLDLTPEAEASVPIDPDLDVFADWAVRVLTYAELEMLVTNSLLFLLVSLATMSSFGEDEKLRMHVLLKGVFSTGKTYLMQKVASTMVERTSKESNNWTPKGLSTDEEDYSTTIWSDEFGSQQFVVSEHESSSGRDTLKRLLTAQRYTITQNNANSQEATRKGQAYTRIFFAVLIAATNNMPEAFSRTDEALLSRFIQWLTKEEVAGEATANDYSGSLGGAGARVPGAKKRFRFTSTCVLVMSKLSNTGVDALPKPNFHAAAVIFNGVMSILSRSHGIDARGRLFDRVREMCEILTYVRATEAVYLTRPYLQDASRAVLSPVYVEEEAGSSLYQVEGPLNKASGGARDVAESVVGPCQRFFFKTFGGKATIGSFESHLDKIPERMHGAFTGASVALPDQDGWIDVPDSPGASKYGASTVYKGQVPVDMYARRFFYAVLIDGDTRTPVAGTYEWILPNLPGQFTPPGGDLFSVTYAGKAPAVVDEGARVEEAWVDVPLSLSPGSSGGGVYKDVLAEVHSSSFSGSGERALITDMPRLITPFMYVTPWALVLALSYLCKSLPSRGDGNIIAILAEVWAARVNSRASLFDQCTAREVATSTGKAGEIDPSSLHIFYSGKASAPWYCDKILHGILVGRAAANRWDDGTSELAGHVRTYFTSEKDSQRATAHAFIQAATNLEYARALASKIAGAEMTDPETLEMMANHVITDKSGRVIGVLPTFSPPYGRFGTVPVRSNGLGTVTFVGRTSALLNELNGAASRLRTGKPGSADSIYRMFEAATTREMEFCRDPISIGLDECNFPCFPKVTRGVWRPVVPGLSLEEGARGRGDRITTTTVWTITVTTEALSTARKLGPDADVMREAWLEFTRTAPINFGGTQRFMWATPDDPIAKETFSTDTVISRHKKCSFFNFSPEDKEYEEMLSAVTRGFGPVQSGRGDVHITFDGTLGEYGMSEHMKRLGLDPHGLDSAMYEQWCRLVLPEHRRRYYEDNPHLTPNKPGAYPANITRLRRKHRAPILQRASAPTDAEEKPLRS